MAKLASLSRKSILGQSILGAALIVLMSGVSIPAMAAGDVVVQGNKRVDSNTVKAYFKGTDGASVDEGVKGLYATGLFEDVKVDNRGGKIVVTVRENSGVNSVKFEGNKKLDDAVLRSEIETKSRGPLSKAKVANDVARIKELYRRSGRNDAVIDYKIVDSGDGRSDVVFVINEGEKVKIGAINFVGNKAYDGGRLKSVITTTETNWLSWLKNSDVYDPDRLAADQEMLRRFYLKNGYPDFRVISSVADFDKAQNAYYITFTVEEGPLYKIGAVDVESNVATIDAQKFKGLVRTKTGDTFNVEQVDKSLEELNLAFAKEGQPFVQARPRGERHAEQGTVNVVYVVEQGPPVYVERINVRGNTRTMDHVIRRELDLAEGDAYNRVLIERAERRLKNLNFFKFAKINREQGSSPDRVILNVDVEEQATGELSLGAGYSSGDGFIGDVSIGEKNFLGRGQNVKLGVGWGQRRQSADFSFTEPYFMGTRVSAGFDVFARKTHDAKYVSYDSETKGFALRAAMPLNENLTVSTRYKFIDQDINVRAQYKDSDFTNGEASTILKAAEGSSVVSLLGYSLAYNTLDNDRTPTKGLYASFSQEFAGVGGDVSFIQSAATARYYYPVWNDIVFMVRGEGGIVTGIGSAQERLSGAYFKGYDLVRGFAAGGIGPRDISTSNLDALGGMKYLAAGAEFQFPIFGVPEEYGLRGALFYDAGTLYDVGKLGNLASSITLRDDQTLRSSVGASVIWASPFGPLRFDFAKTVTKESYDRTQPFRFSAGTTF